jgi:hypothetical protein
MMDRPGYPRLGDLNFKVLSSYERLCQVQTIYFSLGQVISG